MSAVRHADIIWSEKFSFFFEVQSYLPDSGLCSGLPKEFSSSHMESFPWPKADECGTSPDCTIETGRKDAYSGRVLTHSDIYSEAWQDALLLVQLPSQMEVSQSLSKDLTQTFLLFFNLYSVSSRWIEAFHTSSPRLCISPLSVSSHSHQTLSADPAVGNVNDPLTAVPETSEMSFLVSGETLSR